MLEENISVLQKAIAYSHNILAYEGHFMHKFSLSNHSQFARNWDLEIQTLCSAAAVEHSNMRELEATYYVRCCLWTHME